MHCEAIFLGSNPGSLVLNRDMFLNISLIADWNALTTKREHMINENLRRQNQKRQRFNYAQSQQLLKKHHKPTKLFKQTSGPYKIAQVHVAGTVAINPKPGVTERINICRMRPFLEE